MSATDAVILNYDPNIVEFEVIRGSFGGITYFMTTMALSESAELLRVADADAASTLSERIQRRLDRKRAENKIFHDYLKKPGNRFFNSLVVALLPKEGTQTGYFRFRPFKTSDGGETGDLGKLQVLSNIDRVVVDGQHRLQALKCAHEYVQTDDHDASLRLEEMQVPVVFVTFDDVEGDKFTEHRADIVHHVSERARKIFIDLNKGVVKADRNSLLLLDDEDFWAVAARRLIEIDTDLELYTKWDGAASTLPDAEPFYTNIFLLSVFMKLLVRNDDIPPGRYNLSFTDQRESALNDLFLRPANERLNGIAPAVFITRFFNEVSFFSYWKAKMSQVIDPVPKQPAKLDLSPAQKQRIARLRKEHLMSTVAGQRAAFVAVTRAYDHFGSESGEENLGIALRKLSIVHDTELYSRRHALWVELLTRPGGRMKLTTLGVAARLLEHLLIGDHEADAHTLDIRPEEGVGTHDTMKEYQSALETLKESEG